MGKRDKELEAENAELREGAEDPEDPEDPDEAPAPVHDGPGGLTDFIAGLPTGKTVKLFIRRAKADGKNEYVDTVIAPISPEFLRENYGGGDYRIWAYEYDEETGNNRPLGRAYETIPGPPKVKNDNPPAVQASATDKISETVAIIRALNEASGQRSNAAEMIQVMAAVQTTMTQMNTMQMTMMKEFMDAIRSVKSEGKEPGIPTLIRDGLREVSQVIMGILIAKNPAVAKVYTPPDDIEDEDLDEVDGEVIEKTAEAPKTEAPKAQGDEMTNVFMQNLIESLAKGQQFNDPDYAGYFRTIARIPGLAKQLVSLPFDTIIGGLETNGLKITNRPWLEGLYGYIRAEVDKRKAKKRTPEGLK